jgi:hypothetical protein
LTAELAGWTVAPDDPAVMGRRRREETFMQHKNDDLATRMKHVEELLEQLIAARP